MLPLLLLLFTATVVVVVGRLFVAALAQPLAFVQALKPHGDMLLAGRGAEILSDRSYPPIPFAGGASLDVAGLWASADGESREAILQYIQTLYVMGCSVSLVPPQVLGAGGNTGCNNLLVARVC
eukprot:tig00000492_g1392.t1